MIDENDGRRYATARGVAFEAKATQDGTWHGYPIPWEKVPAKILHGWMEAKKANRRDVKKFLAFSKDDIHWALETDDR